MTGDDTVLGIVKQYKSIITVCANCNIKIRRKSISGNHTIKIK